jgi:hypothetical protein
MLNRRRAQLTVTHADYDFVFQGQLVKVPKDNVLHIVQLPNTTTGFVLRTSVEAPGVKKGACSFIVSPGIGGEMVSGSTATACGRMSVSLGRLLVLYTANTCEVFGALENVVLQRTKGGMSTFDAHVVPEGGVIRTIEMLPHAMLGQWYDAYEDKVIDIGPDPVQSDVLELARRYPGGIAGWLAADSGGSGSGDSCSEYDPSAPSSSESDGSCGYATPSDSEE